MTELPDDIYNKITELSDHGNILADHGQFSEALDMFEQAWKLVPEPKQHWEASTWLLASMGDMCFLMEQYLHALDPFRKLLGEDFPQATETAFIQLRTGQCYFELDMMDQAAQHLTAAYTQEGPEIFEGEDPKYLKFLKSTLKKKKA